MLHIHINISYIIVNNSIRIIIIFMRSRAEQKLAQLKAKHLQP
jgi:hypothetical protein